MTTQTSYLGGGAGPPGLTRVATGKVRDIYALDEERLLFVTTDRISAFDVVMNEGVPGKGKVLTRIAAWWFEATADLLPNHLLSTSIDDVEGLDAGWREALEGRVMIVRRAQPTPVEWIVRGYLVGSGWKEYQAQGTVSGLTLPDGLRQASPLPAPLLTPSTKEETHDRPISPDEARELVGASVFERAESAALALFRRGSERLAELGIILADTKFEFGLVDGELILIDEVLTPDSSRFWPAEDWALDTSPPSYDKQILRDYLETLDWDKTYPPPSLDPAVLERVASRYQEVCQLITGERTVGAPA
ncbi:MAG: phosphoribosylaminoimidazolesuccinocarboxamide synthase [Planctomycetota bacterium]|jgi:phosphoribosylaminoimidazole-succinocarboxamide synthase|nr:phosphoribosylaminoimidazolesuccinocarboxamide synthase [Planctomycetota bacterium]MDP6764027.1 phosphoribosylaminoimidazolesuccinocarboxamide synthase [Planctomycetota bacterium]MDP6987995.1 phosphoribosylaminoimidazolesuccinocarboxamide synthase [Planctomycetota bacterium]